MTTSHSSIHRPRAGHGNSVGDERYALLRAAFVHAQNAISERRWLEAISVLESILTDRLGSLVHGSLGQQVTLRDTLGGLIKIAKSNHVVARETSSGSKKRAPLPPDVITFVREDLSNWWTARNNAVHGMAKLHHVADASFAERYNKLEKVALGGVRVLLKLDEFDQRERSRNGAGHSSTWPDALSLDRGTI